MGTLENKIAVITGASRGIGRATAIHLAREGASVVVNYATSAAQAETIVAEVAAFGGKAFAVQGDIARTDDIRRLFREIVSRFGRLDILIANAGYSCFRPLAEITEEDFDRTYAVNAKCTKPPYH